MKLKIIVTLCLLVGIAIVSIASTGSFSSGLLKNKTKSDITAWTTYTTSIDTSEVINMSGKDNLIVEWKVVNTDSVLIALYFWESCNGSDWLKTDSSVTITNLNKYGIMKVNRVGCGFSRITAKGFYGNTNSNLALSYITN
jgi:hypothetical protein